MDVKSVFLDGFIIKKCMLSNHKVLKIFIFPIMFSNLKRPCMILNKHLGHGMIDKSLLLLIMILTFVKLTPPFLHKKKRSKDILIV